MSRVPGVATAPGSVCVEPDYAKLAALASNGSAAYAGRDGCPSPQLQVSPVDGRLIVDATLTSRFDSDQAYATIVRIRSAVSAVPGAQALVGGQSAINYDTNQAARHDRDLIIPVILAVVLVLLMLLLRAALAPVLLVASVALSFAATLGISAFFFNHVFGFANADPSFPLFAFVFLVAFGVDYNIFLMARVREETVSFGPERGSSGARRHRGGDHFCRTGTGCHLRRVAGHPPRAAERTGFRRRAGHPYRHGPRPLRACAGACPRHRQADSVAVAAGCEGRLRPSVWLRVEDGAGRFSSTAERRRPPSH